MALKKGDRGKGVEELQGLLNKKGYQVDIDGDFGKKTLNQVILFQKHNNLTIDGIVGSGTMRLLKRGAKSLKEEDYVRCAAELGVDVATVKAVEAVESGGSGFNSDGSIKILFEGHKFWKEMDKITGNAETVLTEDNQDVLHPKWTRKYYKMNQWERMNKAMGINQDAALRSASYGLFQIMGFNHGLCSFPDVNSFVEFNKQNEGNQLLCFGRFCLNTGLDKHLQTRDWAKFAKGYNGSGYKENKYDTKLAAAYKRFA